MRLTGTTCWTGWRRIWTGTELKKVPFRLDKCDEVWYTVVTREEERKVNKCYYKSQDGWIPCEYISRGDMGFVWIQIGDEVLHVPTIRFISK